MAVTPVKKETEKLSAAERMLDNFVLSEMNMMILLPIHIFDMK